MYGRAVVLFMLAACQADPPLVARHLPIINGTFEPGEPAVVGIGDGTGQSGLFCTGTLVSPHVVVAAAHCLEPPAPDRVYFGSDPDLGGTYIAIKEQHQHPAYDPAQLTADISVIILAEAAPVDATPMELARRAPASGQSATFVGFGCSETGAGCGPYGRKLTVAATITDVRPTEFEYGVATCSGDSGGPAFVDEDGRKVLAGVTSYGDSDCSVYGVDTRVDAYTAFVDQAVAQADPGFGPGDDDAPIGRGEITGGCGVGGGEGGAWLVLVALVLLRRRP